MPLLTIMPLARTVTVAEGSSVLDALVAAGAMAKPKCNGTAECGSCHIFVHEGRKGLSKMQRAENDRLDSIVGVGSKSRLACQAIVGTENATVELLGFNSGL
ncbi:MAG: 2Fe-2S iron-sulfur cluster-binding protein [Stellaceae bacterium]